jgi:hypothetical protein
MQNFPCVCHKRGSVDTTPPILHHATKWTWVVRFTPEKRKNSFASGRNSTTIPRLSNPEFSPYTHGYIPCVKLRYVILLPNINRVSTIPVVWSFCETSVAVEYRFPSFGNIFCPVTKMCKRYLYPEDGSNTFLRNVCTYLPRNTA